MALLRSATKLFVVAVPMLPEFTGTISAPLAIWSWAVNAKREVHQFVTVPVLPTRKKMIAP